jgi:hypothetical protein
MPIPGTTACGNCDGVAKSPSSRNMTIWQSQVSPSMNRRSEAMPRAGALPAIRPAT